MESLINIGHHGWRSLRSWGRGWGGRRRGEEASSLDRSLPFTYLGLPLCLTKPTVVDFWPLVSKGERRLSSISAFLSQARRLELTDAVFSALPTFTMSTFLLPKTVVDQIDKFRKHCL